MKDSNKGTSILRKLIAVLLAVIAVFGFVYFIIEITAPKDPQTNERETLSDVEESAKDEERQKLTLETNNVTLTTTQIELEPIATIDGTPYYIARDINERGGRHYPIYYVKVQGQKDVTSVNINKFVSDKYRSLATRKLQIVIPTESDTFTNSIGFKGGALFITTVNPLVITTDVSNLSQNLDYNTKVESLEEAVDNQDDKSDEKEQDTTATDKK